MVFRKMASLVKLNSDPSLSKIEPEKGKEENKLANHKPAFANEENCASFEYFCLG